MKRPLSCLTCLIVYALGLACSAEAWAEPGSPAKPPNILFAISDDQSWIHAGAYGTKGVDTPAFDRVAREGVLFQHAFCAAPSCAPSRAAILTGQHPWRLRGGGNLMGVFPSEWPVFPHLLRDNGYTIGYTGKAWSPGRLGKGWDEYPAGKAYRQIRRKKNAPDDPGGGGSISSIDYAANFKAFLDERPKDKPFFFWYGSSEPHLAYNNKNALARGKKLEESRLFSFWPDVEPFRADIAGYAYEIEWFDKHLAKMLAHLEAIGELDNTIIIVTSDNGNPLARSKCNLYDAGVRMPLAIRLPGVIPGGRTVTDFTTLTDIGPTLLELTGIEIPEVMSGRSLLSVLKSEKSGRVDETRDFAVTHFERHTWCRPGGVGYPVRAIRTDDYLYIRNYEPNRWPAGDPDYPAIPQGQAGDIDRSASKSYLMQNKDDPAVKRFYDLAIGKRPAEELYDVRKDPDQVVNLADDPAHREVLDQLRGRLNAFLKKTGDPRQSGQSPWDTYEYTGGVPKHETPLKKKFEQPDE